MAGLAVGVLATSVAPVTLTVGAATAQSRQLREDAGPVVVSALYGSMNQEIAPRQFSGAATGLR